MRLGEARRTCHAARAGRRASRQSVDRPAAPPPPRPRPPRTRSPTTDRARTRQCWRVAGGWGRGSGGGVARSRWLRRWGRRRRPRGRCRRRGGGRGGLGEVVGEVGGVAGVEGAVAAAVQDQRGGGHLRQHVAEVGLQEALDDLDGAADAGAHAHVAGEPAGEGGVADLARRPQGEDLVDVEEAAQDGLEGGELVWGRAGWVVGGAEDGGGGVGGHAGHPVGVGDGGEEGDRAAVEDAEQRGPAGPHRVHHGEEVVHVLGERGVAARAVGHAGAALVEQDQPAAGGEAAEETGEGGVLPADLQVAGEAGEEHQVDGAVAQDLVGEGGPAAAGEAGDRRVGAARAAGRCREARRAPGRDRG